MPSNRGVAYVEPGKVEVRSIAYSKLKMPASETTFLGLLLFLGTTPVNRGEPFEA